jgi:hypothetical protein
MTPIASSIHNLSKTDGLMNCGGTMQSQQMTCEEALGARYLKDVLGPGIWRDILEQEVT